ncbi:MAG: HIT family protein [Candidatus Dormibacteria bacterium]
MTGQEGVSVECVLCDVYDHRDEADSHVVVVGGTVFTMLNKFPYSSGHLMVVPVRHVRSLPELDDAELLDAMHAVGQAMKVLEQVYGPDGFNVGINDGEAAGASLPHIHIHVVPRWSGDTNFMPVISGTKVMPESLTDSAVRLREAYHNL